MSNFKSPLDFKKPFARLQFLMLTGLFVLTGIYVVNQIYAATGTLSFAPSATTVNIGDTIRVEVRENSGTDLANAVEADVRFDATKLSYVSLDETGSAFGIAAATDVTTGSLNIARGRSGGLAAVSGSQLVTTITFKALATGSVTLSYAATSAIVRSSDNVNILVATTPTVLNLADTAAPTAPTSVAAPTIGITSVGLTWSASTDNVGVTGYRIYRNGVQVGTSTATNFTNSGLAANTAYTFSVAAVDAAGNLSAQSAGISAQTLADTISPSVPGTPTSASQTITSISISWPASTDNIAVTSYRIFRNGVQVGTSNTTSFTDQGLAANTSYAYSIAAVDASNNASAQSFSITFKTLADTVAPSTPIGLSGTVSGSNIDLTWTASTDNIGVVGYLIYRDNVLLGTSPSTTFRVTGALTGTHVYTVQATDAANNKSAQSTGTSISIFVTGDINRDGKVDVFDLSALLANWSRTGINSADLNADSIVNVFDLSILLSNWTG